MNAKANICTTMLSSSSRSLSFFVFLVIVSAPCCHGAPHISSLLPQPDHDGAPYLSISSMSAAISSSCSSSLQTFVQACNTSQALCCQELASIASSDPQCYCDLVASDTNGNPAQLASTLLTLFQICQVAVPSTVSACLSGIQPTPAPTTSVGVESPPPLPVEGPLAPPPPSVTEGTSPPPLVQDSPPPPSPLAPAPQIGDLQPPPSDIQSPPPPPTDTQQSPTTSNVNSSPPPPPPQSPKNTILGGLGNGSPSLCSPFGSMVLLTLFVILFFGKF